MKIITLTLNPAFDIHCFTENFQPYHENLAMITAQEAGGKGVNISRALTANGIENTALIAMGMENASGFRQKLDADDIRYREIMVPGRIRENITLHTEGADETRISFPGFRADASLLEQTENMLNSLWEDECFVTFTGRIPDGLDMTWVKAFLLHLKGRGAKIVIDSRSFTYTDLSEVRPWLIKPNEEEISMYLKRPIHQFEEVVEAAGQMQREGIANVMISLGAKGALLVSDGVTLTVTPPQVHAVSTIGAGDSSIAGFLAAAVHGKSPAERLRRAVSYGTAACLSSGTRPPLPDDVQRIYEECTVKIF